MPIDSTHPLYDEFFPKWARARDVIAGEDRVKEAGETYLPRLDSQSDDEFDGYVHRASFFNATGRTADGFSGMVFRRDPIFKLPEVNTPAGKVLDRFKTDIDMLGTSLYSYVKHVANAIMATGRGGTLVEWHDVEQRPFVCFYEAEQVINWRMERINGTMTLSLVVLRETFDAPKDDDPYDLRAVPQIRVLRLVSGEGRAARGENGSSGESDSSAPRERRPTYVVEVWRQTEDAEKKGDPHWELVESLEPKRLGQPLGFIPFVFHGPLNDLPTPTKPPLDDIIVVNLGHYRLDADFKHGLHFTALPTAWVAGFDKETTLKIGSSTAWVSDDPQARAGYLEFQGQGLQTFEREKDRVERLMAILGSRMLESQKRVSESAEALSLRQAGESSVVANMSGSISKSLTKVVRWAYWWLTSEEDPEEIPAETVSVELNKDFETATMTAQELVAVVQAWQAGLVSHDSALNLLRQGELLPPSRTNEEELELIEARPPLLGASGEGRRARSNATPRASLKKVRAVEAGEGGGSLAAR